MDQGPQLTRLALFGQPVKASLSPAIHRMFADQLELDIRYDLIETGAAGFASALESFRLAGGAGCNITLPLKGDAYRLASDCSDAVSLARAANTLVRQPGGWFAHNTDGPGLIADLAGNNGVAVAGRGVLVLGAGGAVAGILGSLLAAGPARLVLVNRNLERARVLADHFGLPDERSVTTWAELPRHPAFDVVINATSLGHKGEIPPLTAASFGQGSVCYDLNYHHASEPLKAWCETHGQTYLDGLGMLVEQAAESFSIWTGQRPDSTAVIQQLRVVQG